MLCNGERFRLALNATKMATATTHDGKVAHTHSSIADYEHFVANLKQQGPPPPPPRSHKLKVMTMEPVMEQRPLGTPPRAPSGTQGYHSTSQPAAVTPTGTSISAISDDETFGQSPEGRMGDESVNVDEALLDLAQLEELHQEAERMKALGNKHMAAQVRGVIVR